jgi:tetrathionate reductase subunit A
MMSKNDDDQAVRGSRVSRRDFMKSAGTAAAALALDTDGAWAANKRQSAGRFQKAAATRMDKNVKVVHSVCLACNARCGVRGVVEDGRLVNISGNPYHPYNMNFEGIAYGTPVADSLTVPSPVCGKSLDTPNHIYSPYRVLKPLKRSGPRGSGKFEPIEWNQLISEISHGGRLFKHLGEDRIVEGLKDLNSDLPVDPKAPELGPKRNAFVMITGRLQSGRKEFIDRFVKSAIGSKNRIGHTDICGLGFRMGNWALTEKNNGNSRRIQRAPNIFLCSGPTSMKLSNPASTPMAPLWPNGAPAEN